MLVDANVLLYAVDRSSPFHERAATWIVDRLEGTRRVGLPWHSLLAFLRLSTNPRVFEEPLAPEEAWRHVDAWLGSSVAWIPSAGRGHQRILRELSLTHHLRAGALSDAHLAALAIEHGLTVCSADTDFARFTEIRWENPLAG
jgi:toxin-antitoxin system PIN domain toxin